MAPFTFPLSHRVPSAAIALGLVQLPRLRYAAHLRCALLTLPSRFNIRLETRVFVGVPHLMMRQTRFFRAFDMPDVFPRMFDMFDTFFRAFDTFGAFLACFVCFDHLDLGLPHFFSRQLTMLRTCSAKLPCPIVWRACGALGTWHGGPLLQPCPRLGLWLLGTRATPRSGCSMTQKCAFRHTFCLLPPAMPLLGPLAARDAGDPTLGVLGGPEMCVSAHAVCFK